MASSSAHQEPAKHVDKSGVDSDSQSGVAAATRDVAAVSSTPAQIQQSGPVSTISDAVVDLTALTSTSSSSSSAATEDLLPPVKSPFTVGTDLFGAGAADVDATAGISSISNTSNDFVNADAEDADDGDDDGYEENKTRLLDSGVSVASLAAPIPVASLMVSLVHTTASEDGSGLRIPSGTSGLLISTPGSPPPPGDSLLIGLTAPGGIPSQELFVRPPYPSPLLATAGRVGVDGDIVEGDVDSEAAAVIGSTSSLSSSSSTSTLSSATVIASATSPSTGGDDADGVDSARELELQASDVGASLIEQLEEANFRVEVRPRRDSKPFPVVATSSSASASSNASTASVISSSSSPASSFKASPLAADEGQDDDTSELVRSESYGQA